MVNREEVAGTLLEQLVASKQANKQVRNEHIMVNKDNVQTANNR